LELEAEFSNFSGEGLEVHGCWPVLGGGFFFKNDWKEFLLKNERGRGAT
jgi:hypothetical protein